MTEREDATAKLCLQHVWVSRITLVGCLTVAAASTLEGILNVQYAALPERPAPPVTSDRIIRVAYQGEPEGLFGKSTQGVTGRKIGAIRPLISRGLFPMPLASECDYACLYIENSLGGSIHHDLMMRYDLQIVKLGFRVKHCLLAVCQGQSETTSAADNASSSWRRFVNFCVDLALRLFNILPQAVPDDFRK
jgi:hypothetical protein